jgi:hypothetical protein
MCWAWMFHDGLTALSEAGPGARVLLPSPALRRHWMVFTAAAGGGARALHLRGIRALGDFYSLGRSAQLQGVPIQLSGLCLGKNQRLSRRSARRRRTFSLVNAAARRASFGASERRTLQKSVGRLRPFLLAAGPCAGSCGVRRLRCAGSFFHITPRSPPSAPFPQPTVVRSCFPWRRGLATRSGHCRLGRYRDIGRGNRLS